MAKTERLTARAVMALAKKPRLHADGGGLYLQATDTGASWVYRFMLNGRARTMGLGPLALVTLAEARALARDARILRHKGIDPIEARRASRAANAIAGAPVSTFQQCAAGCIKAHRAEWRNDVHAKQWEASLENNVYPTIGALPVAAIDTAAVLKVLQPIWATKRETASRVRGRIESILDWAKVAGHRTGENPARWRGHLEHLLAKKSKTQVHLKAMPYDQLPGFLATLREQEGVGVAPLEFTILTAARTDQTIAARWSEINLTEKTWTIPADRMLKNDLPHRVPLSDRALAVLGTVGHGNDFVFPGETPEKPLANSSMLKTLRRMGHGVTVHGFRSSFKDWAAEQTGFPNEVSEAALSHVVANKVEAAYRRGDLFDKRRKLMDAWARYCTAGATVGENVVAINGAR